MSEAQYMAEARGLEGDGRCPAGVSQRNWDIFRYHVEEGVTMTALAQTYQISHSRVRQIIYRVLWLVCPAYRSSRAIQ